MPIDLTQLEKTLKEIAEKAIQVSETAAVIPEPKPTFDVDTPTGEVDISELDGVQDLRNQVRGLETRLASEKEAQEELIAAIEPTPRALELQQEILTARQVARAGELAVRAQPIPQPLIGRQAELLRKQIELREMPLIEELKLEVQRQQTTFEKAKARLGFETAGIERVLDLESEFRQMDRAQRQDARGLLEGIIGSLEGMAFEDLSPEQQTMLETMITDAGVSPEVIKAGMANAKRLALEKAVPKDDATRVASVDAFINANRGADGLISAETYLAAQKKWIAEGGTITDFRASFLPSTLMRIQELRKLPVEIQPKIVGERFLNTGWFNQQFTPDELQVLAEKHFGTVKGFFDTQQGFNRRFVDEIIETIDEWQDAGYTDREILELMGLD